MIKLRGMAEHGLGNVYNYQCLTKVLYLFMWNTESSENCRQK